MSESDSSQSDNSALLQRTLAAAAAAANSAETARAEAAAASAAAARLDRPSEHDDDKIVQEALRKIPYFGFILAHVAKHAGIGAIAVLSVFLVLGPLAYPLLLGIYSNLLPDKARASYIEFVQESLGIDKALDRTIRESTDALIAANNDRIDFVQQFQHTWGKSQSERTPAYRFPLRRGQEFTVTLKPTSVASSQGCSSGSTKERTATDALNDEQLFSIRVFGRQQANTSGNIDSEGSFSATDTFWKDLISSPKIPSQGVVQVYMSGKLAALMSECWTVKTDLTIVVSKTLPNLPAKTTKPVASSTKH